MGPSELTPWAGFYLKLETGEVLSTGDKTKGEKETPPKAEH